MNGRRFIILMIGMLVFFNFTKDAGSFSAAIEKDKKFFQCNYENIDISIPFHYVQQISSRLSIKGFSNDDAQVYISPSIDLFYENCVARLQSHSFNLRIAYPFNLCGTTSKIIFNPSNFDGSQFVSIEFTNKVWMKTNKLFKTFPIFLHHINCTYKNASILETLEKPTCCNFPTVTTPNGKVQFKLQFWNSSPLNFKLARLLAPPFICSLKEKLYVTIKAVGKLNQDPTTITSKSELCYISDSFALDKSRKFVSFNPSNCSDVHKEIEVQTLQTNRYFENVFSLTVAQQLNMSFYYLHCFINVMIRQGDDSSQIKQFKRYSPSNFTKNLNVSITSGPVMVVSEHIENQQSSGLDFSQFAKDKIPTSPTPQHHDWFLLLPFVITNFLCVIMIGFLCYCLARSIEARRRRRNRALTGESLFCNNNNLESHPEMKASDSGFLKPARKSYEIKCSTPRGPHSILSLFRTPRSVIEPNEDRVEEINYSTTKDI